MLTAYCCTPEVNQKSSSSDGLSCTYSYKKRTILEYENFNFGNSWRLQGAQANSSLNINNNYVILNDKRFIEQTEILNKLLPGDIVDYELEETADVTTGVISNIHERKNYIRLTFYSYQYYLS